MIHSFISGNKMTYTTIKQSALPNFSTKQCGASLLEGIAYLGIAAMVILGAVSLLSGAFSSAQSNRGTEELVSIRTAVKKYYGSASSAYGSDDMTAKLYKAKVFPSTMTFETNKLTNSWGGNVTVNGNTNSFIINYTKVPQDVCLAMVSGASGWTKISAGDLNTVIFPASPDDAQKICASNPVENLAFESL